MTYPNGRVVDYVYNAGLDNAISRLSALADDNGGTPGTHPGDLRLPRAWTRSSSATTPSRAST